MPTVEQLQISYASDIAAKATADSAALDRVAAAVETTDTLIRRSTPSIQAMSNQLDGNTAATTRTEAAHQRYQSRLESIAAAEARAGGATAETTLLRQRAAAQLEIDTQKATAAGQAIEARFNPAAKVTDQLAVSSGNAAFAMRQLGVQSVQAISGIATGQSVLQVLIQQGHQVGDVMLSTGSGFSVFGNAAKAAWGFVTSPTGAVIAAVAAVGGAVALAASHAIDLSAESRTLSVALAGVGRSADASTQQLQGYITTLNRAGVSRTDAAAIVTGLARNPQLPISSIGQIAGLAPDVAAGSGQSVSDASKQLGGALSGNYDALKKLDDELNFLTADQRTSIRTFLEHGDQMRATTAIVDALNGRFKGLAKEGMSDSESAWQKIKNAINATTDALSNYQSQQFHAAGSDVPAPPRDILSAPDSFVDHAGSAAMVDQTKKLDELTRGFQQEQQVLAAGLPVRDAVRARLEAETKATTAQLGPLNTQIYVREAVAAAAAKAADAGVQESAAQQRAIAGGLLVAGTLDQGRAATITATAATEAHAKAATQAGISEVAYAQALLNRGAAEAAAAAVGTVQDLRDQLDYTNRIAAAEQLSDRAAHYTELSVSVDKATVKLEAQRDAAIDPRIRDALATEIADIRKLSFAIDDATAKSTNLNAILVQEDQLTVLRKQGELIGASATAVARQVAELQTLLQLEREQGADPAHLSDEQQRRISLAGDIAAQTTALQEQRQLMDELANVASSAFDQVGQAITSAFVNGSASSVNFGNITKSVIASVIGEVAKLAILNPVLNSVFGGNRATVSNAVGLLGGAANDNAAGASGSSSGALSNLTTIGGLATNSSVLNALGLTGPNGLMSSLGLSGNGGIFSGINGLLNTPLTGSSGIFGDLFGAQASAAAANTFMGAPDGFVAATGLGSPAGTAAGATLGGALGAAGLGFGAGSLAGGFVQSSFNKTGPGPEIGAALGTAAAIAGVLLAPETFGASLILPALFGGAIGRARSQLIGRKTVIERLAA